MSGRKRPSNRRTPPFLIGATILVRMGPTVRRAEIVEDRGPIGRGGRRILRVRFVSPKGEQQPTFEVPLEHVSAVNKRAGHAATATKSKTRNV